MDLRLNDAVVKVELSGIRQFTYLVRDTPGARAAAFLLPGDGVVRRT